MKIEVNEQYGYQIVTAEDGMYLCNGSVCEKCAYTPIGADLSMFHEVDEAFKEQHEAEERAKVEAELNNIDEAFKEQHEAEEQAKVEAELNNMSEKL